MKTLPAISSDILVSGLLRIAYQQWSALGVAVNADRAPAVVIDPEALLWFTVGIGRHDARLFDEVVDWLQSNHSSILVPRLRRIGPDRADIRWRVLAAIRRRILRATPRSAWDRLPTQTLAADKEEWRTVGLFLTQNGIEVPVASEPDPDFAKWGLQRPPFDARWRGQRPRLNQPTSLLLRARALFGRNARACLWAALLTREGEFKRALERRTGYGSLAIAKAVKAFVECGICREETRNKAKWCALVNRKAWQQVLDLPEIPPWPDWRGLFEGLLHLCRAWATCKSAQASEYIFASELRKAFLAVEDDIAGSGVLITSPSPSRYLVDEFPRVFKAYAEEVLTNSLFLKQAGVTA